MCGRIFQTHNLQRLIQIARTSNQRNTNLHNPNFNTGPTSYIPAVRQRRNFEGSSKKEQEEEISNFDGEDKELDFLKWGYDAKFSFVINARIEELQDKKMFKNILNSNRCAVIVEGYFEWNEKKEPFAFKPKGCDYFFIAALYFNDDSVILLTRESTKALQTVHHRMPVLLEGHSLELWLDPTKSFVSIIDKEILNEKKEIWSNLDFYKVGPFVNNVKNKSEKCIMCYEDYIKELDSKGIKQYFKPKALDSNEKPKIEKDQTEKKEDKNDSISQKPEKKEPARITPLKRKEEKNLMPIAIQGKKSMKSFSKDIRNDITINSALKDFINS